MAAEADADTEAEGVEGVVEDVVVHAFRLFGLEFDRR